MEFETINQIYHTEFTTRLFEHRHIFYEIYNACGYRFDTQSGSYLFDGKHYQYCPLMYEKQEILYNAVKSVNNVLEIGVYMGHSLLIMLLSNPTLKITCIDINSTFALPAITVLNKYFPDAITFIHSDSLTALSTLQTKFDFFHVDGHHDNNYISNEFFYIQSLNSSTLLKIIFDDQENLVPLQEDIQRIYKIKTKIIPSCPWSNVYYEIHLN